MFLKIPFFSLEKDIPKILKKLSNNDYNIAQLLFILENNTTPPHQNKIYFESTDIQFFLVIFEFYKYLSKKLTDDNKFENTLESIKKNFYSYISEYEDNEFKNLNLELNKLAVKEEKINYNSNNSSYLIKEIVEKNRFEFRKQLKNKENEWSLFFGIFKSNLLFIFLNIEFINALLNEKKLNIYDDENKEKELINNLSYIDKKIYELLLIETNRAKKIECVLNAIENAFIDYKKLRGNIVAFDKFKSFIVPSKTEKGFQFRKNRDLNFFIKFHEEYLFYLINIELFYNLKKLRGNAGFLKLSESEKILSSHLNNLTYEKIELKNVDGKYSFLETKPKICEIINPSHKKIIKGNLPLLVIDIEAKFELIKTKILNDDFISKFYTQEYIYCFDTNFINKYINENKNEYYRNFTLNNNIYNNIEELFFKTMLIFSNILEKNIEYINNKIQNETFIYQLQEHKPIVKEKFDETIKNFNLTLSNLSELSKKEYEIYRLNIVQKYNHTQQNALINILNKYYKSINTINLLGPNTNSPLTNYILPEFLPKSLKDFCAKKFNFVDKYIIDAFSKYNSSSKISKISKNQIIKNNKKIPVLYQKDFPSSMLDYTFIKKDTSKIFHQPELEQTNLKAIEFNTINNSTGSAIDSINKTDFNTKKSINSTGSAIDSINKTDFNTKKSINSDCLKLIQKMKIDCINYLEQNEKYYDNNLNNIKISNKIKLLNPTKYIKIEKHNKYIIVKKFNNKLDTELFYLDEILKHANETVTELSKYGVKIYKHSDLHSSGIVSNASPQLTIYGQIKEFKSNLSKYLKA